MADITPIVVNPEGSKRVVVTKELPGTHWQDILTAADCRIEIMPGTEILSKEEIIALIGDQCDGAIGQLTEAWDTDTLGALKAAGGTAYSNYAVGFNNVDVAAANELGLPVGNTPGVLTETTAELAIALTFAASRRIVESDQFMRSGQFHGWLPQLFMGQLFHGKTVGIIGAGRIGAAYARMMVEGHKMNLVYYDLYQNESLEDYVADYGALLEKHGEPAVTCQRVDSIEELLKVSDLVSLHTVLDENTKHLINEERLNLMKKDAILVNSARGPIIDENALVAHCQKNPDFRVGLDVFEEEPAMAPGLADLDNVVIVPHIASATVWTREGMASLAASNVAGLLQGYSLWDGADVLPFLEGDIPQAMPNIVNASEVGIS
ncbi:D-glycerate dehydrogenase [Verrucomicrobiaceae bacterium N1E253]|uniref:D-glycerate dehydrogenase n=1 Tax=Oceaniferula marina TaxID=2748318 RepID=A0A851GJU7_9BACT|nr:NAD(P)-dependent oxidoreductase [Oceaniferula marina]NWK57292.1 D-glycerate dehydrogenase [Oceaniferula marina]